MQKTDTFALVGGDRRQAFLAGLLAEEGYTVIAAGLEETELPCRVTGCTNPGQAVALADWVVLPLPVTRDGTALNAPFSRTPILLSDLAESLTAGQRVFGGNIPPAFTAALQSRGVRAEDYFAREELAILNAVPTAEGAVQLAMEELPVTLQGSRCLITGFGRVGSALARLLRAMGARVTVAARSAAARAGAAALGCGETDMAGIGEERYDVIFNTVPARIFTADLLKRLDRNTLIIDLASRPGGVDMEAAAALSLKTVWALSLPGRVAPKSAAAAIRRTLLTMLGEVAP